MIIEASLPTRRKFWLLCVVAVAVLGAYRPARAEALPATIQPVSIPLSGGTDRNADGAMRLVSAILEYSRWPAPRPNLTLCVVGPALHASLMERMTLSGGRTVFRRQLPTGEQPSGNGCDVFYIGRLDALSQRRWTKAARGRAIVTIAEDDPKCASEAMFCLHFGAKSVSFDMNIDAVSRSTVRIDPRVFRLSQGAS